MANFPFNSTYNASAFDGTVESDFLRLSTISESDKKELINYSNQDFDTLKAGFIEYIKIVYGDSYNNFVESDLGMMLIELYAYWGSVISLKGDFIANERFLRTAQNLESVRLILSNLGIDLKGPVASKASAAVFPQNVVFEATDTLTIPLASRSIITKSDKDNQALTFTLYKTNLATGKIDQVSQGNIEDLEISDSYLSFDESSFEGLVLLEGFLKTKVGTFPSNVSNQIIKLPDPSIVEASIFVSASDGYIYNEIQSLALASGSASRVFEKDYGPDYSVTLYFGDNIRGASPQPGVSYKVFYRVGGGERGNLVAERLSVSVPAYKNATTPVTVRITNSTTATGGVNAESVQHAKKYAPYFFRAQYRAVTGKDYVALANTFTSVAGRTGKAIPVVRKSGAGGNMIDIYVLLKSTENHLERAPLWFKGELLDYLNQYKMDTVDLTIVDGLIRTVDLVCTMIVDKTKKPYIETIKRIASDKLLEFFNADRRDFGQPLSLSELQSFVLQSNDIRFFKVDNLDSDITVNYNEIVQLNNFEINVEYV